MRQRVLVGVREAVLMPTAAENRRLAGFRTPPPGTPMCQGLVRNTIDGRLRAPRPCRRAAKPDSCYCGVHKKSDVEVNEGGFCVWCGQPGRSYICDRVTIALCGKHGKALARVL